MNSKNVSFRIFAVAITLMCFAFQVIGQDRKGGLLDVFSGNEDPAKDREITVPKEAPKETPAPVTAQPAETKKSDPGLIYLEPDPKSLDKRIEYIKGLDYEKMEHVPDIEKARQRIEYLRDKARQLRLRNDKETVEVVGKLSEHKKRMEQKWLKISAAMKDGKQRTAGEWAELAKEALEDSEQVDLEIEGDLAKKADDQVGLPLPGDAGDKEAAGEDKVDPLDPVKVQKPEGPAPPKLDDLIAAIEGQKKPAGIHPLTWVRLLDNFGQDLEQLRTAHADAVRRLKEKREQEYAPVLEALKAAQNTYSNLSKLDNPGKELLRHLAYRIYQAELAQLELRRKDLQMIEKERKGEKSDRSMNIRTDPMAPEKTLMDITRLMEVSSTPGPPTEDTYKDLTADGLPDLYPPGTDIVVDKKVQYGNLVRANIARYQRSLKEIHSRMANAETLVKSKEEKLLRRKASELLHQDRLNGKEDNPLNQAYNRRDLKKMQQELQASRTEHVKQLKEKLTKEAQAIIKRLEIEYQRLTEMQGDD